MKLNQFIPFIFVCFLCFTGCSKPEKQALDSFQPVIKFLSSETNSDGTLEFKDFVFNINKTDSIVSPFTGDINFKLKDGSGVFNCNFALQDNKWVHKSIVVEIDAKFEETIRAKTDEETKYVNDDIRATIKKQNMKLVLDLLELKKGDIDRDLSGFLKCPTIEN